MSFKKFVESTLFKILFDVLVIVGVFYNSFYIYEVWQCQEVNSIVRIEATDLNQQISELSNQENYQNSNLYKDKLIRDKNFRYKGEQVIDTSFIERRTIENPGNYVPESRQKNLTIINKWTQLLTKSNTRTFFESNNCQV